MCSRSRTTGRGSPHRSSSPRSDRGSRWSALVQATATAIPTAPCSTGSPVVGRWCCAPIGMGTPPSWAEGKDHASYDAEDEGRSAMNDTWIRLRLGWAPQGGQSALSWVLWQAGYVPSPWPTDELKPAFTYYACDELRGGGRGIT